MTEDNFISHVEYKHKLQDCLNKITGFKYFHSSQEVGGQCEPLFHSSCLRFLPFPLCTHLHCQYFPHSPCFLCYSLHSLCQRSCHRILQFLSPFSAAPFVSLDGVWNEKNAKVKGYHWQIKIMLQSLWMFMILRTHPCVCKTTNYLEFGSIISPRRSTGGSTTFCWRTG